MPTPRLDFETGVSRQTRPERKENPLNPIPYSLNYSPTPVSGEVHQHMHAGGSAEQQDAQRPRPPLPPQQNRSHNKDRLGYEDADDQVHPLSSSLPNRREESKRKE